MYFSVLREVSLHISDILMNNTQHITYSSCSDVKTCYFYYKETRNLYATYCYDKSWCVMSGLNQSVVKQIKPFEGTECFIIPYCFDINSQSKTLNMHTQSLTL